MRFNSENVAFGRHETFSLRYSWLPKGFKALKNGNDVFSSDEATVILGVGKNMVLSIRYWLRACQLMEPNAAKATLLGEKILDTKLGFDPYLEDEATIWLAHWLLATNPNLATSWFWFFNRFHKPEFTAQELLTALTDFTKENVAKNKRPSLNTLKSDAGLIPRMYAQLKFNAKIPLEETLDSPFSLLGLITQTSDKRVYQSKLQARPGLPVGIFGFAVAQIMEQKGSNSIPIEDLMVSRDDYPAPGAVFRLTETDLITKLEDLVHYRIGDFEIRETAGIHQFYQLKKIEPMDYIDTHYKQSSIGLVA
jgi:Protein of unknown function (DUF4007)